MPGRGFPVQLVDEALQSGPRQAGHAGDPPQADPFAEQPADQRLPILGDRALGRVGHEAPPAPPAPEGRLAETARPAPDDIGCGTAGTRRDGVTSCIRLC